MTKNIKKASEIETGTEVRKLNNSRIYIMDKEHMLLIHGDNEQAVLLDEELEII